VLASCRQHPLTENGKSRAPLRLAAATLGTVAPDSATILIVDDSRGKPPGPRSRARAARTAVGQGALRARGAALPSSRKLRARPPRRADAELDGFETAALIRERERNRHTPIIFVTRRPARGGGDPQGLRQRRGGLRGQALRAGDHGRQGPLLPRSVPAGAHTLRGELAAQKQKREELERREEMARAEGRGAPRAPVCAVHEGARRHRHLPRAAAAVRARQSEVPGAGRALEAGRPARARGDPGAGGRPHPGTSWRESTRPGTRYLGNEYPGSGAWARSGSSTSSRSPPRAPSATTRP